MLPRLNKHLTLRPIAPLTVALMTLLFAPLAAARSAQVGYKPRIPAGARAAGSLPGTQKLTATVTLAPPAPAALAAYARAVSTPGSASYRHYLSVAEFRRRFAPGSAQAENLLGYLRRQGLQTGQLTANGLSVDVNGSAATMARAFQTRFERYRLRGGRLAYANTSAPSLSTSVSGSVQGVLGLSTVAKAKPLLAQRATPGGVPLSVPAATANASGPAPCAAATSAASGAYTADQLAAAYRFPSLYSAGDLGGGVTVALYELEPYSSSDISAYKSCYGTSTAITNVTVAGGAGTGPGQGEAALDIEDVIGLAPAVKLRVYEGPNTDAGALATYEKIVSDDIAKVVSTSWGLCESQNGSSAASSENTVFEEAATQGQSVYAASGDSGTDDCGDGAPSVDDPASQPYVTGVGGTSMSAQGPPPTESVWNNSSGAGGGGVSSQWTRPTYQTKAISQSSVDCGAGNYTCREVPDVSADADPDTGYVIYYGGSWGVWGGTSAAAPTWAALTALADASSSCAGKVIGFANPALYAAPSSDFDDVTSGSNSYDGVTGYSARAGYDMASGLGTPNGAALAGALCAAGTTTTTTTTSSPTTTTSTSTSRSTTTSSSTSTTTRSSTTSTTTTPRPVVTVTQPANQTGRVGTAARLAIHATDSAGRKLHYAASGLPSGLSISSSTGIISGTPKTAQTKTVAVKATDTSGYSGSSSFKWTVASKASVRAGPMWVRGRSVRLTLKLSAGTNAAGLWKVRLSPRPKTLRFATRAGSVETGVIAQLPSGRRGQLIRRSSRSSLLVMVRHATPRRLSLNLNSPAVSVAQTLLARLHRRHATSFKLPVTITDDAGLVTQRLITVRVR